MDRDQSVMSRGSSCGLSDRADSLKLIHSPSKLCNAHLPELKYELDHIRSKEAVSEGRRRGRMSER